MLTFSVVIPLYNKANFIGKTLECLQKQDYIHWEAIVVNDGSTDEGIAIVNDFADRDNRIKLYTIPHAGVSNARNVGISYCTGTHIKFLDADDLLVSTHFTLLAAEFKNRPSTQVIFNDYNVLLTKTNQILPHFFPLTLERFTIENVLTGWEKNILVPIHCACFNAASVPTVPFLTQLNHYEDWCFWIAFFLKNPVIHFLPFTDSCYVMHGNNTSTTKTAATKYKQLQIAQSFIHNNLLAENVPLQQLFFNNINAAFCTLKLQNEAEKMRKKKMFFYRIYHAFLKVRNPI